jgi:hypothetical protein
MGVVHYDPYIDADDTPERTPCGTIGIWEGNSINDTYENTSSWKEVTCKRCLNQKEKLIEWSDGIEKSILSDMAQMVKSN